MPTDFFNQAEADRKAPQAASPAPARNSEKRASIRGLALLAPKSIRSKLIVSLLLIYVLGSLAALLALVSLSRMQQKIGLIEQFYELNQKILETRRYEKNFLLYGNLGDLMSALDYLDEVRASFEVLHSSSSFSRVSVALMLPKEKMMLEEYADLLKKFNRPDLEEKQHASLRENLRERGHALTQSVLEMDALARQVIEKEVRRYRDVALIILVWALLFGAVITFLLVHWIIGPLQSIRQAAAKIMRGELSAIPMEESCRSSVECAELVNSLNLMLNALQAKQSQLVQSTKLAALGRVTAGIAHEINNPLNNIYLTSEVLLEDLANLDAAERREMVQDILTQADRAREVVRHLLAFSRSRKNGVWEQVDVAKLLRETLVLLKNQLRIGRIHVHTNIPSESLTVVGNADQLQQVFVNIILNAVQAMESGGILSVRAAADNGHAVLAFTDTGPGIPEEIKAQIFDPFFTTKTEGTGLGLSVSHSIIKEHKGEILLENDTETGTTTFRVILPRHQEST